MENDLGETDETSPSDKSEILAAINDGKPSYIVGIGASAGGLEALERLFEKMPADTGMAFVVVQHLSPDFKSVMDELLARKTSIPIHRVENSMEVQSDAIYLIPPKKDMIIANGRLLLTDKDPKQVVTLPIDHFFRSLAQEAGERAIGIVLSGTGSDGSRGIREIHEAGGLVIVQSPETAKFDGMPNSAKQTGAVDIFLAPEEMPAALLRYANHLLMKGQEADADTEPDEGSLTSVFRLLRDNHGIDFSNYKMSTVGRRIDRRLLMNRSPNLEDYVRRLRENPAELNALYKDLLIGVTRFFRDAEAFEVLCDEVLSGMLQDGSELDELRLWVAGCATGEEAYSLAILLTEQFEKWQRVPKVKIFATDVHRASIDFASAGIYSEAQLAGVSPERLQRFFLKKNDGFHVVPELRQMVVFASHNLLKDAPFTKLDLITCRNLLIYLQPVLQKKVLSLFHFALKTGGVLFLGPSESPGELSDEFSVVNNHWRLYRKRREIRLPADLRLPMSLGPTAPLQVDRLPSRPSYGSSNELMGAYDAILEEFMPPALLVDERGQLVHSFGDANRFLQLKKGRVSTDLLDMVEPVLKTVLTGALSRVALDKVPVAYKRLQLGTPQGERSINLTVKPIVNNRSRNFHMLVCFEEQEQATASARPTAEVDFGKASTDQIHSLENELRYAKENLQATIEELETSNEELQATNEELVASNEELQSTNEELHSVNEELYSVNAEYQKKITELTELTSDMNNLLESTQVHTLFLDRNLCIRKFTPRIGETFNLLPQDVGRRIDTFTNTIDYPALSEKIREVMKTGEVFERQVCDWRHNWYLLRILPYRSKQLNDGVVLTLVDLTNLKAAENEARHKDQLLSNILENSPHLVSIKDEQGRYLATTDAFQTVVGCNPIGKTTEEIFPATTAEALVELDRQVLKEGLTVETEIIIPHIDGPHTYLSANFPLRDQTGRIAGVSSIKTDVTRLKLAEQQAREAVEQRDRFLAILSHELRNPLGAMANALGVLNRYSVDDSERNNSFSILQRQMDQMSRLLDDLLEVSRITQAKIHLSKEAIRLEDIIDEAIRVVKPMMDKGRLRFEVEKQENLPGYIGDPGRLQQMVINLLTNAAKYTQPGGLVNLSLSLSGDDIAIRVRDTGIGIRPEILSRIFDLFVQAEDTLDRSHGGIGVGLSLVRAIADLHGGTVEAQSAGPGKGSEFIVRLPIPRDLPKAVEMPINIDSPSQPKKMTFPTKVVIVEDNEDSRYTFAKLLRLYGAEVFTAGNGKEGLEAIESHRPKVAFVDIGLPLLNGYELARAVRNRGRNDIYLVALTGYGQAEDRRAVLEAGFDEHLVKPLKKSDLERVLESVV